MSAGVARRSARTAGRVCSSRRAGLLAIVFTVVVVVATGVAGVVLHSVNAGSAAAVGVTDWWLWLVVVGIAYTTAGAWLAREKHGLVIGWLMLLIGLLVSLSLVTLEYGVWSLSPGNGAPLAVAALWFGTWVWSVALLMIGAVLPLLLPEGRPSRSRLPLTVLSAGAVLIAAAGWALTPYATWSPALALAGAVNPFGLDWASEGPQASIPPLLAIGAVLLAWVSLGVEWRRSSGPRRQQLKWIFLGGLSALVLVALGFIAGPTVTALAMIPLPVAIVVAVLRYGLWNVDLVISRSLIYALLTASVAAVYVGCISLLGGVLGSNTAAAVIATALVALGIEPAQRRLRAMINRVVFGEPDDPLVVLAAVGRRLDGARDADAVAQKLLPEVVASVAGALRLPHVAIALSDGTVAEHGISETAPIERQLTYAGRPVGQLLVSPRQPGLGRSQRRLLDQLAGDAAVAAHTVLLSRELARSREQVAMASEEERRRLYRELHDGLGPAVAALALQTETARDLVRSDPAAASALLGVVVPQLRGTVGVVRGLLNGLRPAALDHLGLDGAVRELCERFASPALAVSFRTPALTDLPVAIEVAAYRIVAESLTNVARHSGATTVTVSLCCSDDELVVAVDDNGCGSARAVAGTGWTSMSDRASELAGRLAIGQGAISGTRVEAHLPLIGAQ